ncbi:MAG: EamA family transporter [Kutzneria sp.]|nr:EamA family transporter [Kutzneria sp.]
MKPAHVVLAVTVAVVWGVNFVVIDVGLRTLPPLLFTALRFTVAALPAVLFVGRPRVPPRWVLGVGLSTGALQFGLMFTGMHMGMPAGLTSLVIQIQVLFTAGFSAALTGERPTVRQWIGMAVALGGVVLVGVDYGQSSPVLAFLLVLAGAASWGLGNVLTRKAAPPDGFRFMVWISVVPPLPLLTASLLIEGAGADLEALRHMNLSALASLGYVAWFATLLGYGSWSALIRRYQATTVAPYALLVPVFGMTSAALFVGEPVTPLRAVAAALVVLGVAVATVTRRNARAVRGTATDRLTKVG